MIRTQIQLPEPLYREVQRVAQEQEWSIAEVIRRGAEAVARAYPASKGPARKAWTLGPPIRSRLLLDEPRALADAIRGENEASIL
ncbi:MAG: hypothetical protein RL077_463 [Verrucomicrobiota bacterium]